MEAINIIDFNYWGIIKLFVIVALGLYIVFAIVITRQVKVMTNTLTLGFEGVAKLLSFVHLLFAILVFITALMVL